MTSTLPLVRQARRWVAPDGRVGAWQRGPKPTMDAMTDAVRAATGKTGLEWGGLTKEWRQCQSEGWAIETEGDE